MASDKKESFEYEKTVDVIEFKQVYPCKCSSCGATFVLYVLMPYGDGDYGDAGDYLLPQVRANYCPFCGEKCIVGVKDAIEEELEKCIAGIRDAIEEGIK